MPVEIQVVPFLEYLPRAIAFFIATAIVLGTTALVIGYIAAAVQYGPIEGLKRLWRTIARMGKGILRLSPRRIGALSGLAIREAIRRRVLVVVVVFAVILLFAGWFLDTTSPDPGKLYLTFVLSTTSYLVLLLALFLSTFSLPNDIKTRTIHTVITKPVHAGEIVLGRIIGFSVIGTILLVAMGAASYLFVIRGLSHTHQLTADNVRTVSSATTTPGGVKQGRTSFGGDHQHDVSLDAAGNGWTNPVQGHRHFVTARTNLSEFEEFAGTLPTQWTVDSGSAEQLHDESDPARVEWGFRSLRITGDGRTPISLSRRLTGLTAGRKYHVACWIQGDSAIDAGNLTIGLAGRDMTVEPQNRIELNAATLSSLSRFRLFSATIALPAQLPDDLRITVAVNGLLTAGTNIWLDGLTVGDQMQFDVGPPEDRLAARVPIYGKLRFRDRSGADVVRGISVGAEWSYRSFVDGGTVAAAIWRFEGLKREDYPQGLPIEMSIRVFRTTKGLIEEGIRGSLVLRNPETGRATKAHIFRAKDQTIDQWRVPLKVLASDGNQVDVFSDLVTKDGQLEIWMQCIEGSQYFGVAQADLYLRKGDGSFEANLFKGYVGLWLQMLLVTGFGVMFSTFLSAPVAMLATASSMLMGFQTHRIINLANSVLAPESVKSDDFVPGGGPIEALIRIFRHENLTRKLEPSLGIDIVQTLDRGILHVMRAVGELLPNYSDFNDVDYVTHGFNIPPDLVWTHLVSALGYMIAVFIAGYLFLRSREVAK